MPSAKLRLKRSSKVSFLGSSLKMQWPCTHQCNRFVSMNYGRSSSTCKSLKLCTYLAQMFNIHSNCAKQHCISEWPSIHTKRDFHTQHLLQHRHIPFSQGRSAMISASLGTTTSNEHKVRPSLCFISPWIARSALPLVHWSHEVQFSKKWLNFLQSIASLAAQLIQRSDISRQMMHSYGLYTNNGLQYCHRQQVKTKAKKVRDKWQNVHS